MYLHKALQVIATVLLALFLGSCAPREIVQYQQAFKSMAPVNECAAGSCLQRANTETASILAKQIKRNGDPEQGDLVIATSFVNVDKLDESSTFGRVTGHQLSAGLAGEGILTVELKTAMPTIQITKDGELAYTRKLPPMAKSGAYAFLAGTYALGPGTVTVTAQVVRSKDNAVIAGHTYVLPLTMDLLAMFPGGQTMIQSAPGIHPTVSTSFPNARRTAQAKPQFDFSKVKRLN